jgi:hypothetical protein
MKTVQFIKTSLPEDLVAELQDINPWWAGKPAPRTPLFRRWIFEHLQRQFTSGITPAVLLRGPRRVGKTVLVQQIIAELLKSGVNGNRILYVPFDELKNFGKLKLDEPILGLTRWFQQQVLGETFNESARANRIAYLLFDEAQNLKAWAPQLKHLVDNHEVRALVTGSSSLRIEAGRDSLAGRVTTLTIGTLLLREIAALRFGQTFEPLLPAANSIGALLQREFWEEAKAKGLREREARFKAFQVFSERGGYPAAQLDPDMPWEAMADQLNESVIMKVIRHDLRLGPAGRKRDAKLLEEVFRLCCRYAGQTPGPNVFVPETRQVLRIEFTWSRILRYLQYLDDSLLLRLIPPLELRLKRQASPAKVCLCDHALRASWLQEIVPIDQQGLAANPDLMLLAGHLAESVLGYFLSTIPNLDVAYFPARGIEPEVDFVLTIGTRRIPVEVKYRRKVDYHEDTRGLRAFLEKTVYNAPFGLLVTLDDEVTVYDPRIIPISLSSFLWMR